MPLHKLTTLTGTSPAAASTTTIYGSTEDLTCYAWFTIDAILQGGTGGTLNVYLQREVVDDVWVDWIAFPQIAAAGSSRVYSFDSRASLSLVTTVVGTGTDAAATPVLTAGTMSVAHPGSKARLVMVTGVGNTVGAAQTVHLYGWRAPG
jgi:hypothetical protein